MNRKHLLAIPLCIFFIQGAIGLKQTDSQENQDTTIVPQDSFRIPSYEIIHTFGTWHDTPDSSWFVPDDPIVEDTFFVKERVMPLIRLDTLRLDTLFRN